MSIKGHTKDFSDKSIFKEDKFKSDLDKIEERLGKKERKKVEAERDIKHLEEVDKSTGPEYVIQEETRKLQEAQAEKELAMDYIDSNSHSSYRTNLAEWGMYQLIRKEFDPRFEYHCIPTRDGDMNIYGKNFKTQDGIVFVLKAPNGGVYIKAMRCSYIIQVDIKAVSDMCVEVENTYDYIRGTLYDTPDSKKLIL